MTAPTVHLVVPAQSKNVSLIRHAIAGLGELLGADEEALANLKTVVSEACTNAVLHAYDEGDNGVIDVRAEPRDEALEVIVRDFGHGFRPRVVTPDADADDIPSLRLGLPLIAALSAEFELRAAPGGGTAMMMLVSLDSDQKEDGSDTPRAEHARPDETVVSVEGDVLAGVIISRVISSIAARAELTVDRLSDALLLSDAISSEGGTGFVEGRTRVGVEEADGTITVRVGPLHDGTGEQMLSGLDIPGLEASLASLADEVLIERGPDGEHLMLKIAGRSPAPPPADSKQS
jgi:serine/threonine-protein kinase RsbW